VESCISVVGYFCCRPDLNANDAQLVKRLVELIGYTSRQTVPNIASVAKIASCCLRDIWP